MTSRTVVATFDVYGSSSKGTPTKVYDKIHEKLYLEYLKPYIVEGGHIQNDLPRNTFVGTREAESADRLLEELFDEIDSVFFECEVQGRCFFLVSGPDEAKDVRDVG